MSTKKTKNKKTVSPSQHAEISNAVAEALAESLNCFDLKEVLTVVQKKKKLKKALTEMLRSLIDSNEKKTSQIIEVHVHQSSDGDRRVFDGQWKGGYKPYGEVL